MRSEASAPKQKKSSLSTPAGSVTPATAQPPAPSSAAQYSKWPISSENETLYECAAHTTRVCSLDVAYIGWKAVGMFWQLVPFGSNLTSPNPLAMLAFIEPLCPEVRSLITTSN